MKTLIAVLIAVAPAFVLGQSFPTKPIRLVVPFGPGGVADITARTVAPEVSKGLGQQIVIENKPGAGGTVAGQDVARAAPDGYTLLLINNGTAVSKALFNSLPYEPERDFEMISTVGFFALVIATDLKSPFKGIQDFISAAKQNPGKLNVATIGIASTPHLAAELFKSTTGANFQIIPYKATGEVVTAAKSGDAAVIFEFLAPMTSHIKSGNLRPLAITVAKRFPTIPDVPTAIEGGIAGYDVASWNGLAAPARTPRPVIDRIHQELVKALRNHDVQKRLADLGVEGRTSTPEELRKFFAAETQRWAKVVETAKIPKQ